MRTEIDLTEMEAFQKKLETPNLDDFFEWASKQIAARFLDRVIKRTPVSKNETFKYRMIGGKVGTRQVAGGTLRRGWTGGKDMAQTAYINELAVIHTGRIYQLTISNNTSYASFVEYGHKQNVGQFVPYLGEEDSEGVRTGASLKKPAVKGQFMMEKSASEINLMAPALAEKLIKQYFQTWNRE